MSDGFALSTAEATIPAMWRAAVAAYADLPFIVRGEERFSFCEVDRRSAALARGLLELGAGKGARIGLLAPNGPDWVIAWLAISRIGAVAVCLSTFSSAPELAYAVRHADVAILLCADTYLRHEYLARLEQAFPELLAAQPGAPLAIAEAPYLRSIWLTAGSRPWARGSLADLETIGARATGVGPAMLAAVEAAVSPADPALLIYTSGSTARPKGVVHTQGVVVRKTLFLAGRNTITAAGAQVGDRMIVPAPFFWVGGFLNLSCGLAHGACVICVDEHSPAELLAAFRAEHAAYVGGSEPALRTIMGSPEFRPGEFDHLKPLNVAQSIFLRSARGEPRDLIPNCLGMTETFGPHSGETDGPLLPPEAAGSMGKALPGVAYKIVDPVDGAPVANGLAGELCVRTPWLLAGMYKVEREQVFDADGYYRTGDECILREDGYLNFISRLGGMIKTSGANVSPAEVERALQDHPDVLEATVVGAPDPKLGERVIAAVVRRAGSELDENALKQFLRAKLSAFKAPKQILFFEFDELPRTPSNKVRKPLLLEMLMAAQEGAHLVEARQGCDKKAGRQTAGAAPARTRQGPSTSSSGANCCTPSKSRSASPPDITGRGMVILIAADGA
jgi:acyl-CoA synthetase (AMP-forming)/AMP-acid ligase II